VAVTEVKMGTRAVRNVLAASEVTTVVVTGTVAVRG
jgi:hypothetical protein